MTAWHLPNRAQLPSFAKEFIKLQAHASLFAFSIIGLIALTQFVRLPWLARYDWLFVLCILIQVLLVRLKLETWKDAAVVGIFHILGTALELYKVTNGSWFYPGEAVFAIGPVPLFAGFMYGSVASYMCLAWRLLGLRASDWPKPASTAIIGVMIYAQFYFNAWPVWVRLAMLGVVLWQFRRAVVHFTGIGERWQMPMSVAFVLIGSMIYVAENIATFFGAWAYPEQVASWTPVSPMKLVAWILLMTVSLIIVAEYKRQLGQLQGQALYERTNSS